MKSLKINVGRSRRSNLDVTMWRRLLENAGVAEARHRVLPGNLVDADMPVARALLGARPPLILALLSSRPQSQPQMQR